MSAFFMTLWTPLSPELSIPCNFCGPDMSMLTILASDSSRLGVSASCVVATLSKNSSLKMAPAKSNFEVLVFLSNDSFLSCFMAAAGAISSVSETITATGPSSTFDENSALPVFLAAMAMSVFFMTV